MSVTAERTVTAYSKLTPSGNPHLGECTLVMGDGTDKVDFKQGRAEVPMRLAKIVAKHPHIEIPELNPKADAATLAAGASTPTASPVELAAAQDRIAQLEAQLTQVNLSITVADEGEEVDEAIRLAQEHLAEEGEHVPDPEPFVREGFEPLTADNQARCQAAKTDGGQCSNPSVDGGFCNLPKHKDQAAAA